METPFLIENSGIYKLVNKTNGKYYPGSSKNLLKQIGDRGRKKEHFQMLKGNYHHCKHLQNAYNKDIREGRLDNYEFIIIKNNIPLDQLLIEEQKLLDYARDFEPEMCYTRNYIAGKIDFNQETITKISKKLTGRKLSEEHKQQISDGMKGKHAGNKNPMFGKTGELNPFFGQKHTPETIKFLSERIVSDETKNKMSENHADLTREKNGRFIHTIYKFQNIITNEIFEGNPYDFRIKYNLKSEEVSLLIHKKRKSTKKWILIN